MERQQEFQMTWMGQWASDDAELHARKMIAFERAQLMENTLEAVGFTGLCYRLGVMLAKIARNWEPIVRELSDVADDRELQINSTNAKNRRDVVRRALGELQKWGLLKYRTVPGTNRRRTRPTSRIEIKMDPRQLARLAEGDALIEDTNQQSSNCSYKEHHEATSRVEEQTQPEQPTNHRPSRPSEKKEVSEGEVVRAYLELGVRQAMEYVPAAAGRGCSMRDLLAIARWFERSQRRHPTRWDKPATILAMRLSKSVPGVPAWMGWTQGHPPPRSREKPKSGPSYRLQRAAAIAASANSESMTAMFQRLQANGASGE